MKKFALVLIFFLLFSLNVNALFVSPGSGTMTAGSSSIINLYASFTSDNVRMIMVELTINNLTVTSFTPAAGITSALPTCNATDYFTSSRICTHLAKASGFATNELIGTIGVTWGSTPGNATITKATGNGVYNSIIEEWDVGGVYTYTIASGSNPTITPTGVLPRTPLTLNNGSEIFVAATGLSLMFLGIYFFQLNIHGKNKTLEETG